MPLEDDITDAIKSINAADNREKKERQEAAEQAERERLQKVGEQNAALESVRSQSNAARLDSERRIQDKYSTSLPSSSETGCAPGVIAIGAALLLGLGLLVVGQAFYGPKHANPKNMTPAQRTQAVQEIRAELQADYDKLGPDSKIDIFADGGRIHQFPDGIVKTVELNREIEKVQKRFSEAEFDNLDDKVDRRLLLGVDAMLEYVDLSTSPSYNRYMSRGIALARKEQREYMDCLHNVVATCGDDPEVLRQALQKVENHVNRNPGIHHNVNYGRSPKQIVLEKIGSIRSEKLK